MIVEHGEVWRFNALIILPATAAVADTHQPYFAPDLFKTYFSCSWDKGEKSRPIQLLSEMENDWFSKHLRAANEPSLYEQAQTRPAEQVIRFTWLRSFHPPVIVRVTKDIYRNWHMAARELSGAGGYDPGEIERSIDRRLSDKEASALEALLSHSQLPDNSGDCAIGLDGAEWIIERVDATGYHFIKRWSPTDGPVHDVGLYLVGITGWRSKPVY